MGGTGLVPAPGECPHSNRRWIQQKTNASLSYLPEWLLLNLNCTH